MLSIESLDDQQLIIGAAVAAASILVLGWNVIFKPSHDRRRHRLPPKSPLGYLETLRSITTDDVIWFFPRLHGRMESDVCRINMYVPGCTYVCSVADADLAREILTDPDTTKVEGMMKSFEQATDGVSQFFTSNGHRFYHARKAMAPAFASNQIQRMDRVVVTRTLEWMKTRLAPIANAGEAINVGEEMADLTLSIILDAAFECEMTEPERQALMECATITLREFVFANPIKLAFGRFFPSVRLAQKKAKEMMQIARNIMENYNQLESPTKGTVIDLIMNNPNYNSDEERAADVIDLIIAGHETSANSMTLLLLELAKNPAEQRKLQKELKELAVEDRNKSQQLKSCIKESMRLWPVSAPGPIRQMGRDFIFKSKGETTLKDMIIPKGSCVFMPVIALFHSNRYFPEHDKFDPSRWEHPTEEMKKAWMPFAIGRRSCVGQSLANCEMESILSRVCAEYNFEVVEEGTVKFFVSIKPDGVRLKATRI